MLHREELLEDWRFCWEYTARLKLSHWHDRSQYSMYWDVVEVKPEPHYRLFFRFKDGVADTCSYAWKI